MFNKSSEPSETGDKRQVLAIGAPGEDLTSEDLPGKSPEGQMRQSKYVIEAASGEGVTSKN